MRRADMEGTCPACDNPIRIGQAIVPNRRGWVHDTCVAGADDE